MPGRVNVFSGDVRSTGIETYSRIRYRGIYPKIDLIYSGAAQSGAAGRIKSEFLVHPDGDVKAIRLFFDGSVSVNEDGDLVVKNRDAEFRETAPVIVQDGARIPGRYRILDSHTVLFEIGAYDHSRDLLIDPTISFSTYLGGSGMGEITGIAVDAADNVYVTGWTEALNFPIAGAYQSSNGGGVDAFVVKLNPSGTSLLYATYIGGSGDDRAYAIAVDAAGDAYVTGSTASPNFPLVSSLRTTLGGGRDAFALKLNPAGNALVYSTLLGGSNEDWGYAIAVDSSGNAYIAGDTLSTDFPISSAAQSTPGGNMDAFVTKLSPACEIVFSTYLGGSGNEHSGGIAVDSSTNVYVAGGTFSANFPTQAPIQASNNGGEEAFVTKIQSSGSAFLYSTYLGGSAGSAATPEQANAIAVDASGNAYIAGVTPSVNFPVTTGAFQTANAGQADAFVAKINAAGSALVYSTYLGGSLFDQANGIAIDSAGNAYVAGYTASVDFPTLNAIQSASGGMFDAFIVSLGPNGNALGFSTYYGGSGSDEAMAITLDAAANIFVGGVTNSPNFPLADAYQTIDTGGAIGWVARVSSGQSGSGVPDLTIAKSHNGSFTQGQSGAAYTITVSNVGTGASNGLVTVTETIPSGLTGASIAGAGWNCTQPAGPCTRTDSLGVGSSYPAITLNVNVSATAPGSVTNTVSIAGGGETNTSNDQASDLTTIQGSSSGNFSAATMTSPTPGSVFSTSSVTFQWTAGTGTGPDYWIRVGTTGVGSYDIFAGEFAGTSATISGLPTNGTTLYVRLYSQNAGTGAWVSNDYTYTAVNTVSASSFTAAAMTTPAPSSTLTGASVIFQWTAGTGTGPDYWIRVGTTGVGSYNIFAGEFAGTSTTISGLPTNGITLYVRLYCQDVSTGAWISNDYTYTAF